MDRQVLATKYRSLYEQALEKSADWYVYGHAWDLLAGSGDISWVSDKLTQERDQSQRYAAEYGDAPDSQYGTYGAYMRTKARLYDAVLSELASAPVQPTASLEAVP